MENNTVVTVNVKEFKDALKNVMKLAPKATAGIFGGMIEVSSHEDGKLELRVVNTKYVNSIMYTRILNADVTDRFKVVINSQMLNKVIKKNKNKTIQFSINIDRPDKFTIVMGKKNFSLTRSNDELPEDFAGELDSGLKLDTDKLFSAWKRVLPNVSKQESRPALLGINHVFTKDSLDIHATDSHRLGREILHDVHSDTNKQFNIMGTIIKDLIKVSWEKEFLLQTSDNGSLVVLSDGTNKAEIETIEGNYPDVDRLIQRNNFKQVLTVNNTEFNDSLDMAKIATENDRSYVVAFKPDDKKLSLHAGDSFGNNYDELIGQPEMADNEKLFAISYNPDYMVDQMSVFDKNTQVAIKMTQPLRPIVIKPVDVDYDYVGLVTPMRTF